MLKLSKKVEYGILAVQYLAAKTYSTGGLVSAKELADDMNLSFDFLSKTLQGLMKNGLVVSHQGIHGGYKLARKPEAISLNDVIKALEDRIAIVDCMSSQFDEVCSRVDDCSLKNPIHLLQKKIDNLFDSTSVAEILNFNNEKSNSNVILDKNMITDFNKV